MLTEAEQERVREVGRVHGAGAASALFWFLMKRNDKEPATRSE